MNTDFTFTVNSTALDEHYQPADNTRATTNFANLARGENRQHNLRNAFKMIDNRFNRLAHWDNAEAKRYSVELEIVSVEMNIQNSMQTFPSIEMLKTNIVDHQSGLRIDGVVGNNFSSYIRDYDFSILLSAHNKGKSSFTVPENFGELHGRLFKSFLNSPAYKAYFIKKPVICLSVAETKTYQRTGNQHPILGIEYQPNASSLTEQYFRKMDLQVRYFMPENAVAPLAFYFMGDLLNDYTNLELISTISTMETFQKIYRPEIYNANTVASDIYKPDLKHVDYSLTHILYDRDERSRLGIAQGKFAEEFFIKPHKKLLEQLDTQPACFA
ncbi:DUF1852 domain-containing protein [Psychromonas sp.]|uniref:DUF1852 domain-containing protein n=1 Tax=Psychromonas sp. TaxID=1884585 RepID=UPI003A97D5CF